MPVPITPVFGSSFRRGGCSKMSRLTNEGPPMPTALLLRRVFPRMVQVAAMQVQLDSMAETLRAQTTMLQTQTAMLASLQAVSSKVRQHTVDRPESPNKQPCAPGAGAVFESGIGVRPVLVVLNARMMTPYYPAHTWKYALDWALILFCFCVCESAGFAFFAPVSPVYTHNRRSIALSAHSGHLGLLTLLLALVSDCLFICANFAVPSLPYD
eukprot:5389642-Pleurochrysis_carterae.AAC.3